MKIIDDLIGIDLPLGYLVLLVEIDVNAFGQDHLDVAVEMMDHCELEGRREDFLDQLADVLDFLLPILVLPANLSQTIPTFDPFASFYSLNRSTTSSLLEV